MSDTVKIYINDQSYDVPKGANLIDVAKFYADDDIPVFCYHPKMEPVGMCRMCLVELGSVEKDRATGEVMLDENGQPRVRWFPKLQTGCTQIVSDGMVVRTNTPIVEEARDDIIEFLLTSHPLDCPICDKGGECPLQNLTMRHGAGKSRFHFDDKMHLAKHVPLGDLIYLDRERCIQCARCTRFQSELVGDDVLAFHERGRSLQIVTISNPPFDTYFSGNTTDICPVGALTTADFRFEARPWELKDIPSIDPYGVEGANITLSTRLDRDSGGVVKIKRVMPRQNEAVNEIWISDKTRFGHHHTLTTDRLRNPKLKVGGRLVDAEWSHATEVILKKLKDKPSVGVIAGPSLSNEDLWELRKLAEAVGDAKLGIWPATMTGADVIAKVGVGTGTNFSDLGKGSVIVVVASDLEEEAPIWFLRTKVAGDRGATVITLNARSTKLDHYAKHALTYTVGDAVGAMLSLGAKGKSSDDFKAAIEAIKGATNLIVICGADGLTLDQHGALMQASANLLISTGHVGQANNGLLAVWPGANIQGAFDLGYSAEATHAILANVPDVLFVAGCDPVGDSIEATPIADAKFLVVNSLFETATTGHADVVLPSQSFAERDGTFTSGERRVQRFYQAQGVIGHSEADWKAYSTLRHAFNKSGEQRIAGGVMAEIAKTIPAYAEMSYKNLAKVTRQFPDVGGNDLYYGGTAYQNTGGLGIQYASASESGEIKAFDVKADKTTYKGLVVVPVTRLYNRGYLFKYSDMMENRVGSAYAVINPADAKKAKVENGGLVAITVGDYSVTVRAVVSDSTPAGAVLLPTLMTDAPSLFTPSEGKIEMIAEPVAAEG